MRRRRSKSDMRNPMDNDNNYKIGAVVEVLSEQEEYCGGWFQATVVKKLGFQRYTVKYKNFVVPGVDGKKSLYTEETGEQLMRPKPPALRRHGSFSVGEYVEVFYRLGWFKAVVLQVIPARNSYSVRLAAASGAARTKEFHKSKIRACQEWIRGAWLPLHPQARLKPQPEADVEIPRAREAEESDWRDSCTSSSLPEPAVDHAVCGRPAHGGFGQDENWQGRDLVKERCVEAYMRVFGVFMKRGFPCNAERTELLRRLRNELNISVEEHERVLKRVLGETGSTFCH